MTGNRPSTPLFATINVTGVCNLKCAYCFFQPRLEKHMASTDFRRIVNELVEDRLFFINISGGEPFAHPEIEDLLAYAHERFEQVVTLTNGTLLKPKHCAAIEKIIARKGGFPIQISLDAIDSDVNARTRSASDKILTNIEKLSAMGANLVVAIVITQRNADTVLGTIRTLSDHVKHFHIMEVQSVNALCGSDADLALPQGRIEELWNGISALRDELGLYIEIPTDCTEAPTGSAYGAACMAGFTQVVIDPDLKVRPCDRCVVTHIGDLNETSLEDVWNGAAVRKVLKSDLVYCQVEKMAMDKSACGA